MSADELIDRLIYASYVHNRERTPQYTPQQWKSVYPNVDSMEARYQASKSEDIGALELPAELSPPPSVVPPSA